MASSRDPSPTKAGEHQRGTPGRPKLPVEVAILDKSPLVQAALTGLFAQDGRFRLAFVAGDGEQFLETLTRQSCDVAVIGWVLPVLDGRGVLHALKELPEGPRIVVYTGDLDVALPRRAMALGAAGFVSKREPPERLLEVVEAVAGGQVVFPFLDLRALAADPLGTLSPRERELLEALGSGRTNAGLALQLGVSVNTVKFHLRNLFDKIGVRNRAQAVQLWHENRR